MPLTERAKGEDKNDGPERTSRLVDIGKDLGRVPSLSEGSERSRTSIDAGKTDGKDGDADGDVDEMVEALDSGAIQNADEGRRSCSSTTEEEELIVVREEKTDEQQTDDVDDGDTPKGVLDGRGHGLARVRGFGSSQANEFGAGEGEGRRDEHRAHALESVGECSRIAPESATDVAIIITARRSTSTDTNDPNEDEHDDDEELEAGGPELFLGVPESSEYVDENDGGKENGDPCSQRYVVGPVGDGDTGCCDLERENDGPLEDVVPTHAIVRPVRTRDRIGRGDTYAKPHAGSSIRTARA